MCCTSRCSKHWLRTTRARSRRAPSLAGRGGLVHNGVMWRVRTAIRILMWAALCCSLSAFMVPILMRVSVASHIHTSAANAPAADAALVLGASVVRGAPSPVLEKRASAAAEIYHAGKVGTILVSGDGAALSHDEVTPVREYLLKAGVRGEDIFLDRSGLDTYSSMYRARDIFGARSLLITTQDFHLPRALWIARMLGLQADGVLAGPGSHSWGDYLREIPASCKAFFDVLARRMPDSLGSATPLSGDGRATWY